MICFNYLQQKFYLVEPTMKSLAKGTNSDAIFKLIKVLINTQQDDYQMAVQGDTTEIEDVVDKLETDKELFHHEEKANGTVLNESVLKDSPKKSPAKARQPS